MLTARCSFPLLSVYILFYVIILRQKGFFCVSLTVHFSVFVRYSYIFEVKLNARIFFCCCFSNTNRIFIPKSPRNLFLLSTAFFKFYHYKLMEENDFYLQELIIVTWKNKFSLIFKNSNAAACYPS